MAEAGIRELCNHFSQYVAAVRTGEELVVTDRGTPSRASFRGTSRAPSTGSSTTA